jgi:7-carboxy-7-deazaguanine synthase
MGDGHVLGKLSTGIAPAVTVSEVFGPTLQGEGPSLGTRAAFVRLGGCNLHCSWCDTPYTWDATRYDLRAEMTRRTTADIVDEVAAMAPRLVVVTGGEPLLWQSRPGWRPLLDGLAAIAAIEVETNGTIAPNQDDPILRYNVSPKLAHSGDAVGDRIRPAVLLTFSELARAGRAVLKVVVRTPDDVREAAELASDHGWPKTHVYVMPEATNPATLAARHAYLTGSVLEEGLNMTTRLHVLTWGQERGR